MIISVIQSQERFSYFPGNPGNFDLNLCQSLAQAGIDQGFEMMETAARKGAQLIVTIEGFNRSVVPYDARYSYAEIAEPLDGPLIKRFGSLSKKYGIYITAGLYTRRDGKAYNSALLFGPDGHIAGIYDKVHLPFGEFPYFTPGRDFSVIATELGNIGMLVCWDLQYPEAARAIALAGADIIACPTWGWENKYGLCRAYENSVPIAAAMGVPFGEPVWDFCDPSCIVDAMGNIISAGTRHGEQIITAELDLRQEPVPQYSLENITSIKSMRQIRMSQRRPDAYHILTEDQPPLMKRYSDLQQEENK